MTSSNKEFRESLQFFNGGTTDQPATVDDRDLPDSFDSDEYGTSPELITMFQESLDTDRFSLDPAAGAEVIPIADHTFTKQENGLEQNWAKYRIKSIYLNPPYSDVTPWLSRMVKFVDPDDNEKADFGIAVLKCDTSTDWFHDYCTEATLLAFPDDRIGFQHALKDETEDNTGFPCFFALFGDPPQSFVEAIATGCEHQYSKAALYVQTESDDEFGQTTLDELITDGRGPLSDAFEDRPYWKSPPEGGYASDTTWYIDRSRKQSITAPHSETKSRP